MTDSTTSPMIARLRRQVDADEGRASSEGVFVGEARLATILDALGWQAASDAPAAEVAAALPSIIEAAVTGHRKFDVLVRDVADYLRSHAHTMDGGQSAVADWVPMATALLARYAKGDAESAP